MGVFVLFSPRNPKPLNEQDLKKYFGRVWGHLRDREVPGAIGASVMALVIVFGTQLSYLPILMNDPFDALRRSAVSARAQSRRPPTASWHQPPDNPT